MSVSDASANDDACKTACTYPSVSVYTSPRFNQTHRQERTQVSGTEPLSSFVLHHHVVSVRCMHVGLLQTLMTPQGRTCVRSYCCIRILAAASCNSKTLHQQQPEALRSLALTTIKSSLFDTQSRSRPSIHFSIGSLPVQQGSTR